jgi:hypothetical protein
MHGSLLSSGQRHDEGIDDQLELRSRHDRQGGQYAKFSPDTNTACWSKASRRRFFRTLLAAQASDDIINGPSRIDPIADECKERKPQTQGRTQ